MQIGVHSEIGRLQKVIVHTPGREVSLVNPEVKNELLFDDIIFEEDARREHLDMLRMFSAAMPEDGEIIEILDLSLKALENRDARKFMTDRLIKAAPEKNFHLIRKQLLELPAEKFVRFIVEGRTGPDTRFSMHPMPNLLFTRDLAAVVGENIILSRAARKARVRESLLMETIIQFHPEFNKGDIHVIDVGEHQTIEGGDLLVVNEKLVLIGMSERTSFTGLMTISEQLLSNGVEHVVAVDIPKKRSTMHLDTIFTYADRNECIVFPPAIVDRSENIVLLQKPGEKVTTERRASLKRTLEELTGNEHTFINCGGDDLTDQHREQWTDGANAFALAPGVVVGYERNTKTIQSLIEHGYRHLDQFEFIEEYEGNPFEPEKEGKIAITFQGHELCRGRGGARCMTLPLLRSQLT